MTIKMTKDNECYFCKRKNVGRVCVCGAFDVEEGEEHLSLKEQEYNK